MLHPESTPQAPLLPVPPVFHYIDSDAAVNRMLAHNPDLDWDYMLWRANTIPDQSHVEEVIARLREMRAAAR